MSLRTVGKSKKRYNGLNHVTGETRFVDDVIVPGTMLVKALRSPVDKGIIKRLNVEKASQLPGVAGIVTAEDVPCNTYGFLTLDQPVMAEKNIRYKGEPIAAVAAESIEIANDALRLIELEIEKQTPVFDPLEAMKPGAPKVRPEGNVLMVGDRPFRRVYNGDIKKGFDQADAIIEHEYFFSSQEHVPLETQVSLAIPEADGRLTIYTGAQGLYFLLKQMQRILGQGEDVSKRWSGRAQYKYRGTMGFSDIKYVGGTVGGAFGGKSDLHADPITALLALKTGAPCKWRWTREEETLYSTRHSPWRMKFKDGVKKDGRIVARQVESIHEAGAHTGLSSYVVDKHCYYLMGPYHLPNAQVECRVVYTNKTPTGAIRGFGVTPATFACEVQMNRIADEMGIDPWELRFKNAVRNGDPLITRTKLDSVYLIETMQELAKQLDVPLSEENSTLTSAPREA